MIESIVLSLPGTTPHCPSKQITDRGGENKKKGQNKSNFNTNGQKPQTEKNIIHKYLEQNFIVSSIGNYMQNSSTMELKGVIRQLTKNNLLQSRRICSNLVNISTSCIPLLAIQW